MVVQGLTEKRFKQLQDISRQDFTLLTMQEIQDELKSLDDFVQDVEIDQSLRNYYQKFFDVYLDRAYVIKPANAEGVILYVTLENQYGAITFSVHSLWDRFVPEAYQYRFSHFLSNVFYAAYLWVELGESILYEEFQIALFRLENSCSLNLVSRYQDLNFHYQKCLKWLDALQSRSFFWHWAFRSIVLKIKECLEKDLNSANEIIQQRLLLDEYSTAILMLISQPQLLDWKCEDEWERFLLNKKDSYWQQAYLYMQGQCHQQPGWDSELLLYWLEVIRGNPYYIVLFSLDVEHSLEQMLKMAKKMGESGNQYAFDLLMFQNTNQVEIRGLQQSVDLHILAVNYQKTPWWLVDIQSVAHFLRNFAQARHQDAVDLALNIMTDVVLLLRLGWKNSTIAKAKLVWRSLNAVLSQPVCLTNIEDLNHHLDEFSDQKIDIEGLESVLQQCIVEYWTEQHDYQTLRSMISKSECNWSFWCQVQIDLNIKEHKNEHPKNAEKLHF
jgi:hypothetical protein